MAKKNRNREGTIGQYGGRWVGRITVPDGSRKAVYGASFEEVRERLTSLRHDLDQGQLPTRDQLTVEAYFTRWLEDHVKPRLRPATYDVYRGHVINHISPAFGRVRLTKLTPTHVERLMADMQGRGLTATTATRVRATLRVALAKALRQGLVHRNVAALAEPPRVRQKPIEPLTVEEAGRLLAVAEGDRFEALVVLALATGLRQGELLGLRWDDISSDCSTVTVRNSLQRIRGKGMQLVPPKTDRSRRTLPVPASAAGVLRAHRDRQAFDQQRAGVEWHDAGAGGFVFSSAWGRPLDSSTVGGVWWPAVRTRAGLQRVRFHDLRHAAASFLLAEGVGLREVMEHLGHSSISLTANVYAHVMPHVLQASADKLDHVLMAASSTLRPKRPPNEIWRRADKR